MDVYTNIKELVLYIYTIMYSSIDRRIHECAYIPVTCMHVKLLVVCICSIMYANTHHMYAYACVYIYIYACIHT